MNKKRKLVSVKIPKDLHEIIEGISGDTHVPIQKLVEILLRQSPKIKRILKSIE